jgi:hypothetical protein
MYRKPNVTKCDAVVEVLKRRCLVGEMEGVEAAQSHASLLQEPSAPLRNMPKSHASSPYQLVRLNQRASINPCLPLQQILNGPWTVRHASLYYHAGDRPHPVHSPNTTWHVTTPALLHHHDISCRNLLQHVRCVGAALKKQCCRYWTIIPKLSSAVLNNNQP